MLHSAWDPSSLTSLPKDGGVSCFGRSYGRSPIQISDRTQPCLTLVKLMELAGPLGHSPCCFMASGRLKLALKNRDKRISRKLQC